jgi:cobalamin biosynthesis protein CobD/CbiB
MSAILARTASGWVSVVAAILAILGLPGLDKLKELLARIQEILTLGGMALATTVSLLFILAWVLTHLRRPKKESHPVLPWLAFMTSFIPVGLTALAAAGTFFPVLAPYVLKAFALAVLVASFTWAFSVAAVLRGGRRQDLSRARKALLMAGTPWYCLAVWLGLML